MKYFISVLTLIMISSNLMAQTEMPLYNVIPNSRPSVNAESSDTDKDGILRISKVSVPTLTYYAPKGTKKKSIPAMIICPGGGYAILAAGHEGIDVARAVNEWGMAAFVLKYRLPDSTIMIDKSIGPLQDAERAIQLIRQNAKKWNIDTKKIGIMGFSAGGHLAASLSTRYREQLIANSKKISFRPDFSVLVYPVISFTDSLTHGGSRTNLIGRNPSAAKKAQYSNELHVDKKTPPAFLVHAKDDGAVPFANSVHYLEALKKNGVSGQLKIFEAGGHGFGMINRTSSDRWMDDLKLWLKSVKVL